MSEVEFAGPPIAAPDGTTLWLARHAEVEAKYQRVFGGRIDMELSLRGHDQAAALAAFLRARHLDAIYSSPMKRVRLTLDPLLANGSPRPVVMEDLREVDFGDWTGLVWEQVQEKFGVSAYSWLDQLERGGMPRAESARSLRARIEPCLRLVLQRHPGGQVLIACHGGVVRVLLSLLLGLPLSRTEAFEIDYASVTEIRFARGKPHIHLLNYAPWRMAPSTSP